MLGLRWQPPQKSAEELAVFDESPPYRSQFLGAIRHGDIDTIRSGKRHLMQRTFLEIHVFPTFPKSALHRVSCTNDKQKCQGDPWQRMSTAEKKNSWGGRPPTIFFPAVVILCFSPCISVCICARHPMQSTFGNVGKTWISQKVRCIRCLFPRIWKEIESSSAC